MTEMKRYTILLNYNGRQLVYRVSKYEVDNERGFITFFDEITNKKIHAPMSIAMIQEVV